MPYRAGDRRAGDAAAPELTADADAALLRILGSLAEAFVPSLPEAAEEARRAGDERMAAYLEYPGPQGHPPAVAQEMLEICKKHLAADQYKGVTMILWLLSTSVGTLLLGGRAAVASWLPPFACPFDRLSVAQRGAVLLAWKRSRLLPLKMAYRAIQAVVLATLHLVHVDGRNQLLEFIGYPAVDPEKPAQPSAAKLASEKVLLAALVQPPRSGSAEEVAAALTRQGLAAAVEQSGDEQVVSVACDAVVVGSGAGGGVAAGVLAGAGLRVVVVEKGGYTRAQDLSTREKDAYDAMYEKGGLLMASADGGVAIMAGSTVGGATRINWSVAFRTPPHVRREWAEAHGLPAFASARYDRALDAVTKRTGVGTGVAHNRANAAVWRGLEALGAEVEEMPRNCHNYARCGHCTHGCASGERGDVTATFLADAAGAGAKILTGCFAERVLTREAAEGEARRQAAGVRLRPDGGAAVIEVRAPLVLASAGSLHNPALLLRSGITCRGNVGAHLRLHPGAAVAAGFPRRDKAEDPQEGRIAAWEGPNMSAYSRQLADWGGEGYGPIVSVAPMHAGLVVAGGHWEGALAFRQLVVGTPWLALPCTYVRDRGAGRVALGPDGLPRVHYWPSPADQRSVLQGLELAARAAAAAGAESLFTSQPWPRAHVALARAADGSLAEPQQLEGFISNMHAQGVRLGEIALFSLHQMGSCRMGASVADSVADGAGECWECGGLFVADASAFPTATGVNPMVTAQAIAYMVAEGVAARAAPAGRANGQPAIEVAAG